VGGDGFRNVRWAKNARLCGWAVAFACKKVSACSKTYHGLRVCSRHFDPPSGFPRAAGMVVRFLGSDFVHYIVCSGILGSESAVLPSLAAPEVFESRRCRFAQKRPRCALLGRIWWSEAARLEDPLDISNGIWTPKTKIKW
jgi:hypothetical protein